MSGYHPPRPIPSSSAVDPSSMVATERDRHDLLASSEFLLDTRRSDGGVEPGRSGTTLRHLWFCTLSSAVGDHNSRRFLNGARRLHFFQR